MPLLSKNKLICILPIIYIQANLNLLGGTISHPNSATVRYLPLLVGLLILSLLHKLKIKNFYVFSLISASVFYLNYELGICFVIGMFYYLFSINKTLKFLNNDWGSIRVTPPWKGARGIFYRKTKKRKAPNGAFQTLSNKQQLSVLHQWPAFVVHE